jgi:alpha-beta hydrolase superfamily lysophospholipase
MISKDFTVTNKHGIKLACTIDLPENPTPSLPDLSRPGGKGEGDSNFSFPARGGSYALFLHCFTCTKDLKSIININSVLTGAGYSVVRFDMTGIGSSEGEFINTNFTTQLEDTECVIEYMKEHYGFPELIIGHSLGGAVAVFTAHRHDEVKALVTIASASEPSKLALKLKRTRERSIAEGIAVTEIGGVKFEFKPEFFEDLENYHMKHVLQKLTKPLLIMHSPADTYADISNAGDIFRNARQPKSFVSLDNIDHLMLKKEDAEYAGKLIAAWAGKYV